jgi:glycosyltransferase involved in cell wall biosynthesis
MKVFQLIQNVESLSAGPTYSVSMLAKALIELGDKLEIVTYGHDIAIKVEELDVRFVSNEERLFSMFNSAYRVAMHEIYSTNSSIIHGHGVWKPLNFSPLFKKKSSSAKIVWSPRGMLSEWSMRHSRFKKIPVWVAVQKPALNNVDCFHATAESEYLDIRRLGFKQPVTVIPNGLDMPEETTFKKNKTILFLSRIHQKKGLELLIDCWAEIADDYPDWSLKIAGPVNDDYSRNLRDYTLKRELPRLQFIGEVVDDEKTKVYSEASLFVLPTYSENFGIVIAEALAHKTPVITTTETPWQVLAEKNLGWVIEPKYNDLKTAMIKSMSMPSSELNEMGERGSAWVQENLGWKLIGRNMHRTYEWLHGQSDMPEFVITD